MRRDLRYLICTIFLLTALGAAMPANAGIWPFKKKEAKEQPADTAAVKKNDPKYDKLFAKGDSLSKGLLNVHFTKGKVYFEVPDSLLGRIFVMGSTVKSTSDNANGVVGSKDDLIPFAFAMADSCILVRDVGFDIASADANISSALAKSNIGAVRRKFKIAATSPDGYSVIDVTDWFLGDDEQMRPLLKLNNYSMYKRSQNFKKDLSYIEGVKSFEDNLSVTSSSMERVTIAVKGTSLATCLPVSYVDRE